MNDIKVSYDSRIFRSFDELEHFVDNLGDDSILITKIHGYSPITFMRRNIERDELDRINSEYHRYYTIPNQYSYTQIMYRKNEISYEVSDISFRSINAISCWPILSLPNNDIVWLNHNNTYCLHWGRDTELETVHTVNYFKMVREFKMEGYSFAGDCAKRNYIKVGFSYKWIYDK